MVHGIILYKYMPWEAFVKTIESWSLKGTYPTRTNDPLEFMARNNDDVDFLEWIRNPATSLPYFHSFSAKVTDVAMWGRYADSARGVCLAFCFPSDEKIEFSKERGKIIKKIFHLTGGRSFFKVEYDDRRVEAYIRVKDKEKQLKGMMAMLTTKAKCWKDECEYRCFDNVKEADKIEDGKAFYEKYMRYLCGIILGERCEYSKSYVQTLFKQYRKKKVEDKNVNVMESTVKVKDFDNGEDKILRFPIQFVRSTVGDEQFRLENNLFEDNMLLEQYMKKVPDAKIMEILDSDGAV